MARMRVAIVGGCLQGIEATYLCSKAAFETILLDSDPNPPAKGLANAFHKIDVIEKPHRAKKVLRGCDVVLPATENKKALSILQKLCRGLRIPFMQDNAAFWITSNKTKSMEFLRRSKIPTPKAWPKSGFPVIVKPSSKSGSQSVYRADDKHELKKTLELVRAVDPTAVIQEFIEGQALSLEIVSRKGVGRPLQITGLEFDDRYGCKRVHAPVEIPSETEQTLNMIGLETASNLGLNGLTDVQALLDGSTPRVNEINARFPSQTPTVVYHSTGINIAELLVKLFVEDRLEPIEIEPKRAVLYQHVKLGGRELRVQGEHMMADAVGLKLRKNFLGADEAITNLRLGSNTKDRVATLIVESHNLRSAFRKMADVVGNIMNEYNLNQYIDISPTRGTGSFDSTEDH